MKMKRKMRLSLLATVLGATLALGGCASTDTQRGTGETIDDAAVTAKVKAALVDNDIVEAGEVNVTTYRGVVQLSGFVDSNDEKTQATQAAKSVSGVKDVRNDLKVQGEGTQVADRSAGAVVDDSALTAKVKTALIGDETTKGTQINVETRDGVVQLAGFVNTDAERERATEVARGVSGVKDVRNDLQIKPKQQ
ncbi:MAG TPA: BON domain-containing protein [Steroidobacteraceae bacterium]|nr:BON domain-containing protein [Steroidobacteraceae bacterium]